MNKYDKLYVTTIIVIIAYAIAHFMAGTPETSEFYQPNLDTAFFIRITVGPVWIVWFVVTFWNRD